MAGAAGAIVALSVGACSSDDEVGPRGFDAAPPPPPGACIVARSALPACEAGPVPSDGGSDGPAEADADVEGGADATAPRGTLAPPESENHCLVVEDVTLACPSNVTSLFAAPGKDGATDIVLSQLGKGRFASATNASLVPDGRAHVQWIHIDARGEGSATIDPIPPFSNADPLPQGSFALVPTESGPQLLYFTKDGEAQVGLQAGALGAPVVLGPSTTLPMAISSQPHVITSALGESFVFGEPRRPADPSAPTVFAAAGPLVMVRGLPGAPRATTTSIEPRSFVARTDPSGEPAVLFHDGARIHLRTGGELTNEPWSAEVDLAPGSAADVGWLKRGSERVAVVLYRERSGLGVRYADGQQDGVALARLGESFSTCPRTSYLGVTCSECPTGESCETGSDAIRAARMFADGDRLFVAFLATETRRRMGYARSVVPIIDVGCACTLEEREKRAGNDSLVVVEVVPVDGQPAPAISERMRLPLAGGNTTGYTMFAPRGDGELDVVTGPELRRVDGIPGQIPEGGVRYRLTRLSTRRIP